MFADLLLEGAVTRIEGPLLFARREARVGLNAAVEVQGEDGEPADHLDRYEEDFDWDDETPIGLEYDGYNDADNY